MWGSLDSQNEELLSDEALLAGYVDCGIWELEEFLARIARLQA